MQLLKKACLSNPSNLVPAAGLILPKGAEFHTALFEDTGNIGGDHHAAGVVGLYAAGEEQSLLVRVRDVGYFEVEFVHPRGPFAARAAPGISLDRGVFEGLLNGGRDLSFFDVRRANVDDYLGRLYVPGTAQCAGAAGCAVPWHRFINGGVELFLADEHSDVERGFARLGTSTGALATLDARKEPTDCCRLHKLHTSLCRCFGHPHRGARILPNQTVSLLYQENPPSSTKMPRVFV